MTTIMSDRSRRPMHRVTAADIALLRQMAAAGASAREIAAAIGCSRNRVPRLAAALGVKLFQQHAPGPKPGATWVLESQQCTRCKILLARAPGGHGDLCGWCLEGR